MPAPTWILLLVKGMETGAEGEWVELLLRFLMRILGPRHCDLRAEWRSRLLILRALLRLRLPVVRRFNFVLIMVEEGNGEGSTTFNLLFSSR
jgi:hypothetical protein